MSKFTKPVKEIDFEHEENKLKGLINSNLAQHLYFLQNARKEEAKLDSEIERFTTGTRELKKKLLGVKKKRRKAEITLEQFHDKFSTLKSDNFEGLVINNFTCWLFDVLLF